MECKHLYQPAKQVIQQLIKRSNWLEKVPNFTVLNQEEIYLYCEKCWDFKKITNWFDKDEISPTY